MTLPKLPRSSLVQTAIEQLRKSVEGGDWPVGERIPTEPALAEALGIGRNTVREAVRVLVHAGLLETKQGDGTYVRARLDAAETLRRIGRTELGAQLEVRVMLEAEAARLAAQRHTQADLHRMRHALAAREAAGDNVAERIRHDLEFHRAVVDAAHNPALAELYHYFAESVAHTVERTELDAGLPEPSHTAHVQLLEAIEERDATAAGMRARALLDPSLNALRTPAPTPSPNPSDQERSS